ncbi:MAG TPA: hypothetical protein PLE19_16730 [Planctomycetota bacterium]|nr:hypothetical protein [Planctomycetota bacterium]HRR79902.1 hypothetical protein [Planctomycetota bacterium]HRT95130.1 hypothetical protein [Planctomycetota bacterium]
MTAASPPVPRGIEVLVKKASVDAEFKSLLLARRAEAAREIGLELTQAETAMLNAVTAPQLEAIIAQTTVSPMSRAAFLGKAAAVMLAALGADLAAMEGPPPPGGIAPDVPGPKPTGITPDRPPGRERFVLYSESDYKGEVTLAVVEQEEYNKRLAEITATNRVIRQAYAAAMKAWSEDEARKGTPFPLKPVLLLRCTREATYNDRDRAEEMLKRRQEDLDRKVALAKEAEERRVAALSAEARAKEAEKAKLVKEAEALFEKKLAELLAGPKPPATDPVTRGTRPDRPMSLGIEPDKPAPAPDANSPF